MVQYRELHGRRRSAVRKRARGDPCDPAGENPKAAAKAPRKKIKATARKLQRPQTVVLPAKKAPILDFPETALPGETEGQSAPSPTTRSRTSYPETPPPFDERFCAECWGLPGVLQTS